MDSYLSSVSNQTSKQNKQTKQQKINFYTFRWILGGGSKTKILTIEAIRQQWHEREKGNQKNVSFQWAPVQERHILKGRINFIFLIPKKNSLFFFLLKV